METRDNRHKRGYTNKWAKAARAYLDRHPICKHCGQTATCVDHIEAHKRNWSKFWDRSNWQPLCNTCHSRKTRQEMTGKTGCDERGWPEDRAHHWNKEGYP